KLKKVDQFTRLLKIGDEMVPLTEEEKSFILRFCGDDMLAEMSRGIIEGSRVKVLEGPMMGMEAYIVKLDRHKRKAWLEMEMFGRIQRIQVGLEITMKMMDDPDAA
ncbi:MAG: transcription antiterminator, partial [Clostridiales bacterium]|nr:transcription antiterminator [Clostridiales bacterium]